MKQRFLGLLTAVVLTASILSGCGSSSGSTSNFAMRSSADKNVADEQVAQETVAATTAAEAKPADGGGKVDVAFSEAGAAGGSTGSDVNPILDQRKIIRSADITLEVDNFDQASSRINSAILGIGFIQNSNINTDRVYVDGVLKLIKRGTIVVRVDRNKFDKVLNGFQEIGAVLSLNINGEDVTEKYFDTESRLKLLRLEEDRIVEYLKKITDPDKIITYESRLTSIRQEIESLTGTLRKLSDLVDLSTITINMNEKNPTSDKPVKEQTYWDRMSEKFQGSMQNVIEFCGNFVIFIVAALPVLVLLGIIAWLIVLIYRKVTRSVRRNQPAEGYPNRPAPGSAPDYRTGYGPNTPNPAAKDPGDGTSEPDDKQNG